MSSTKSELKAIERDTWAKQFGSLIEATRVDSKRTIEEAAQIAGIPASAWASVEAGQIPRDAALLASIASSIGWDDNTLRTLMTICNQTCE